MSWHITFNAPVTIALIAVMAVIHLMQRTSGDAFNSWFIGGYAPKEYRLPFVYNTVRNITCNYAHGNWGHYFSNMSGFILVGPALEYAYGSKAFALIILALTIINAIVMYVFAIIRKDHSSGLGFSGILFSCMILSSFVCVGEKEIPITLILVAAFQIIPEVYDSLMGGRVGQDGNRVGHGAHIIGGITGGLVGFLIYNSSWVQNMIK